MEKQGVLVGKVKKMELKKKKGDSYDHEYAIITLKEKDTEEVFKNIEVHASIALKALKENYEAYKKKNITLLFDISTTRVHKDEVNQPSLRIKNIIFGDVKGYKSGFGSVMGNVYKIESGRITINTTKRNGNLNAEKMPHRTNANQMVDVKDFISFNIKDKDQVKLMKKCVNGSEVMITFKVKPTKTAGIVEVYDASFYPSLFASRYESTNKSNGASRSNVSDEIKVLCKKLSIDTDKIDIDEFEGVLAELTEINFLDFRLDEFDEDDVPKEVKKINKVCKTLLAAFGESKGESLKDRKKSLGKICKNLGIDYENHIIGILDSLLKAIISACEELEIEDIDEMKLEEILDELNNELKFKKSLKKFKKLIEDLDDDEDEDSDDDEDEDSDDDEDEDSDDDEDEDSDDDEDEDSDDDEDEDSDDDEDEDSDDDEDEDSDDDEDEEPKRKPSKDKKDKGKKDKKDKGKKSKGKNGKKRKSNLDK